MPRYEQKVHRRGVRNNFDSAERKKVSTKMIREKSQRYFIAFSYPVGALVIVMVLLTLGIRIFDIPNYILPEPLNIVKQMLSDYEALTIHGWVTLQEALLGFGLAIIVGFISALIIVWSKTAERTLLPLLVLLQTFPKVAIAPLFLIWFGFGILPKIFVSFLICFFPIVINTTVGLSSIETDMLELIKSMAASKTQVFLKVRIPNSLPYFFTGLRIAIVLALVGAIVGEFVGSDAGLGYLILLANVRMNTTALFAIILWLAIIGGLIYYAMTAIERLAIPWLPTGTEGRKTITEIKT